MSFADRFPKRAAAVDARRAARQNYVPGPPRATLGSDRTTGHVAATGTTQQLAPGQHVSLLEPTALPAYEKKPHFPMPILTEVREEKLLEQAKRDLVKREAAANAQAVQDVKSVMSQLRAETMENIENPLNTTIFCYVKGCVEWKITPYWRGRVPESIAQIFRIKVEKMRQFISLTNLGVIVSQGQAPMEFDLFTQKLDQIANAEMDPVRRKKVY